MENDNRMINSHDDYNPLVSICIPTYNCAAFIDETIQSVLEQSYKNIEIIIVDDGSTDETLINLKKNSDVKIKIFSQVNKGASSARNFAINKANGEFIQFLDADDILSKEKIGVQVALLRNDNTKIAVCSTIHFNNGEQWATNLPSIYEERFIYTTDDPIDFYIRLSGGYNFEASMVQTGAWLIPSRLLNKSGLWNESISVDDDGEFFTRVILSSSGIIRSNGAVYYRKYPDSKNNLSSQKHHAGMVSAVNSALLKSENLFSKVNCELAQKAIFRQFVELQIKCFLIEPELYQLLTAKLTAFPKWHFLPTLGGKYINLIAKIFGWKSARRIQLFYKRFN